MSCFRPCLVGLGLVRDVGGGVGRGGLVAELGPEVMFPPAVETGAFPFTAFWSLFEMPNAAWFVSAAWMPA
jgi:hypothetical protein